MAALAAAGDRGAALAAYERFSERLRRELRVAPSRETRELAATLRTDAPRRSAPASGRRPTASFAPARDAAALVALPRPLPLTGRSGELAVLVGEWVGGARRAGRRRGRSRARRASASRAWPPSWPRTRRATARASRVGRRHRARGGGAARAVGRAARHAGRRTRPEHPEDARWLADLARLVPRLAARDPAGRGPPERVRSRAPARGGGVRGRRRGGGRAAAARARGRPPRRRRVARAARPPRPAPARPGGAAARRPAARSRPTRSTPSRSTWPARARSARGSTLAPLHEHDASALVRRGERRPRRRRGRAAPWPRPTATRCSRSRARERCGRGARRPAAVAAWPPCAACCAACRPTLAASPTCSPSPAAPLEPAELDALPVPAPALAAADGVACGLLEGGDGPLGYRHALLREAAYAALEPPRRRLLHERVADALIGAGRAPSRRGRPPPAPRRARRARRRSPRACGRARSARPRALCRGARVRARGGRPAPERPRPVAPARAHRGAARSPRRDVRGQRRTGLARLAPDDRRARGLALLERGIWLSSAICWPAEALVDFREAAGCSTARPGLDARSRAACWPRRPGPRRSPGTPRASTSCWRRPSALADADHGIVGVHISRARDQRAGPPGPGARGARAGRRPRGGGRARRRDAAPGRHGVARVVCRSRPSSASTSGRSSSSSASCTSAAACCPSASRGSRRKPTCWCGSAGPTRRSPRPRRWSRWPTSSATPSCPRSPATTSAPCSARSASTRAASSSSDAVLAEGREGQRRRARGLRRAESLVALGRLDEAGGRAARDRARPR